MLFITLTLPGSANECRVLNQLKCIPLKSSIAQSMMGKLLLSHLSKGGFQRSASAACVIGQKIEKGGRRLNGFLGPSLNARTIPFLVTLLDKTVSVG